MRPASFDMRGFEKFYIKKGETLSEYRERFNLSQLELAEVTGIAQPNLAAMETGRRRLTDKTAKRIAESLSFYFKQPSKAEAAKIRKRAEAAVDAVWRKREQ